MKNRNILLKSLIEHGYRVFSLSDFARVAVKLGYLESSIRNLIFQLRGDGCLHLVKPALYQVDDNFLSTPVSVYEIGLSLVKKGYLSHLSAISLHQLTDQLPHIIYVSTELHSYSKPKKLIGQYEYANAGTNYKIIQVKNDLIWGLEEIWWGGVKLTLTNLEKTLIDGINRPEYCGGFREVLDYFAQAKAKIDISKIIDYATITSNTCLQRVGWCFDQVGANEASEMILQNFSPRSYVKLDVSGVRKGKYNKKWRVVENI